MAPRPTTGAVRPPPGSSQVAEPPLLERRNKACFAIQMGDRMKFQHESPKVPIWWADTPSMSQGTVT